VDELQFEHNLTKTEVTYGLISVSGIRDYFPPPNEKIVVYDDEGKQYITKMHSSAARIDGLTDWYNNHPAQIGDTVTIVINPDKSIKLALRKESQTQPQEESEEALSVTEIVPSMERLVEDFLVTNLDHIEKGLKLYQDEKGIPGRQYSTDIGIIDLLCMDKDKKFVIIEIKKEKGSDKTIGQITRYMGWVKQKLANNQQVRGIIIVHEVDEKLEYSASVMSDVEIKYYKIDLKFISKKELGG
jgi:hypothetical protein